MKRRKRDLDEAVPRPPAELIDELAIHMGATHGGRKHAQLLFGPVSVAVVPARLVHRGREEEESEARLRDLRAHAVEALVLRVGILDEGAVRDVEHAGQRREAHGEGHHVAERLLAQTHS